MPVDHQAAFAEGLLDPHTPVPQVVTGRWPRRYAVYRNNVTVGLVRALEANFPAIRRLLGETYFAGLARSFVQQVPPSSPLLFHYGEALPAFLAGQADLAPFPYLADVARLEQLWRRAYHAADRMPLAPERLTVEAEALLSLVLTPHPAMAVLSSSFAIHSIFIANRAGGDAQGRVDDPARPEAVLVTRPGIDVEVRLLGPGEHDFLSALAGGQTLAEAAETGAAADERFDLAGAIRLMVEAGAFRDPDSRGQP